MIYSNDIYYNSEKFLPPLLRRPVRLSWLQVLLRSLQKKNDDNFNNQSYLSGWTGLSKWSSAVTYNNGNLTRFGIAVYESLIANNLNVSPPSDNTKWLLLENDFVGVNERVKYNSGKMLFEYVLNRYLNVTATTLPAIYINNLTIDLTGFYLGFDNNNPSGYLGDETNQIDFMGDNYSLNTYAFVIFVPLALFMTLGGNLADREQTVRNVADKYVLTGMKYSISKY